MGHPQTSLLTLDEFLAWEDRQERRHEFVGGEVLAMEDMTRIQNTLALNLAFASRAQLRGRGCQTFVASVKLVAGEQCFYPDVIVTCARNDTDPRLVRHPVLLAEVLSPANEAYDRGKKWHEYQRHLASLQTYLLIAQDEVRVDLFRRSGDGWHCTTHAGLDAVIELSDPPCRLLLAELYLDVFDRPAGG
jgi:Uma2 family endonuclease